MVHYETQNFVITRQDISSSEFPFPTFLVSHPTPSQEPTSLYQAAARPASLAAASAIAGSIESKAAFL